MAKRRTPKGLKKYIGDKGLTREELAALIRNLLVMDEQQVSDFILDTSKPIVLRMVARAFLKDLQSGKLAAWDKLLDRAYGKAPQDITVETSGSLDITHLSPDERRQEIKRLLDKIGGIDE